jgi:hypothetical protein
MPIQNYPRFITKASKTAQQIQSGLPIVGSDGVSGDFNALKVNADGSINVAGGGGGGTATSTNQVTQINLATATNTKLDTLNSAVSQYSEQLNQTTELNSVNANTLQTQYNTADIKTNTDPSNGGITIANLLESFGGNSVADLIEFSNNKISIIEKNSRWQTVCSKNFNTGSGAHNINLTAFGGLTPVKLIFHENNVEITDLTDRTGGSVKTQYLESTTATTIVNIGSEIICNLKSSTDYFLTISISGTCHFTAYYLLDPILP